MRHMLSESEMELVRALNNADSIYIEVTTRGDDSDIRRMAPMKFTLRLDGRRHNISTLGHNLASIVKSFLARRRMLETRKDIS